MVKVMIVDDEKHFLEELSKILSDTKVYSVCGEYTNAFTAIGALCYEAPDILLTDVLMPGMSGIELAMYIRKKFPQTRVILMSENPSFAVEGYEAGVSGFILKPFNGSRVVETVRRLA